jgi:hypothetical protein
MLDLDDRMDEKYGKGLWHCDDLRSAPDMPACVKAYLDIARAPAHGNGLAPPLFATYEGRRVRVVMASRFGDVGITAALDATRGYELRVFLPDLSEFRDVP